MVVVLKQDDNHKGQPCIYWREILKKTGKKQLCQEGFCSECWIHINKQNTNHELYN